MPYISILILNSTKNSTIQHKEIRYEHFILTKKLASSLITNKHNHPTSSNFIDYSPAERIINFDQSRQAKLWKCLRHESCELSHTIIFNTVSHLRIPWLRPTAAPVANLAWQILGIAQIMIHVSPQSVSSFITQSGAGGGEGIGQSQQDKESTVPLYKMDISFSGAIF